MDQYVGTSNVMVISYQILRHAREANQKVQYCRLQDLPMGFLVEGRDSMIL